MELGTIQFPVRTIQALSGIAKEKGKTTEQYVTEVLETEILASTSFDEILAPIRQDFKESGMSEDEITSMFEKSRDDVYQESLTKRK